MNKKDRIFVAGHRGLVGSSLAKLLRDRGFDNLILKTRAELDLTDQTAVQRFFEAARPKYVVDAAALVGGILANQNFGADFITQNLQIQTNLIKSSHDFGVEKLLFLGSACIYPKICPQPIKEEYLLTGLLESSNEPYAIAKIAGMKMCESYFRQYGDVFFSLMPTNLYGPGDFFDFERAHVFPALIRKFVEAKEEGRASVVVWGSGLPRRDFLHASDLADACCFMLQNYQGGAFFNVASGKDVSILELAETIREVVGYKGEIVFDRTKPDGTPLRAMDIGRMEALGWSPKISLEDGVRDTVRWFEANFQSNIRK